MSTCKVLTQHSQTNLATMAWNDPIKTMSFEHLLVSSWVPFSSSTTVSSVIIVMAPAIMIPIFIEIFSASSIMMVRPVISVTLFTAIMSICYVGIRILSDFTLWWCILAPLGAWRLVKSMIMWLNRWGISWLVEMRRTILPTIWHLPQNIVHLREEKKEMLTALIFLAIKANRYLITITKHVTMKKQNHLPGWILS